MSTALGAARKFFNGKRQETPVLTQMHTKAVFTVTFFKDGRRVVTGSLDGTLLIWDVQNGALVGALFGRHQNCVYSVAVSPDDGKIASGGEDQTVIIWNVENKQHVFEPLAKHKGSVKSVCFSPDGKRVASGSQDCTVVVWDAETGAVLRTFVGHSHPVSTVAFSPDGLQLASASLDYTILVWHIDGGQLLPVCSNRDYVLNGRVLSVVWAPDGQQLVSAAWDRTVKFWNSSNGGQIGQPCTGHTSDTIYSLAIACNGSFIATASYDKTVRLWCTKTRQLIGQALKHTKPVYCVAISPNGELLVSGDKDGKVQLWSIKDIIEEFNLNLPLAEQQRFVFDISPRSNGTNEDLPTFLDRASDRLSESNGRCESHDTRSSLDFLPITTIVLNACMDGDLHITEELLTEEIHADANNYNSYANRAVVRARGCEWDLALQDAAQSITIKPSLLGYISKGIALCGKGQLRDAMEALDLGFTFSNSDPMVIDFLLLVKAVTLFNAGHYDEAMRRVQDLATSCQRVDTFPCALVDVYLRAQHGIIAFENGQYDSSADQLKASITCITELILQNTHCELIFKIFAVLFGWNLYSLWKTANQRRCDALFHADRLIEAIGYYQYVMDKIDNGSRTSWQCLGWSVAFKQDCTARCVAKGDEAVVASKYENAIRLYSAAIRLDSSCNPSLFARRSKAKLRQNLYMEALADAEKIIELNVSSYLGYELKYAALHAAERHDEAIEAFKIMLSKLDGSPDAQARDIRRQYGCPSEVEDIVQRAVRAQLENTPHRLLNTGTGRLCDREAQINDFKTSAEYKELLASTIEHADIKMDHIQHVVATFFRCVMLSHRWESREPLLRDIQGKALYGLNPDGSSAKLQSFCATARDAGYRWVWVDTCCIDQSNNVEVQESVNSMFIWYRHSALTIVYLSDVPPSSKTGALAKSIWNTRGWTLQEFLAPRVVLFYQEDWTLYLNDHSPNHKESIMIMQELGNATGIDARALLAFRPGMRDAREKLQWASMRVTTLQEDMAYSLFGIFGIHLPVIYGEKKQNALGRLLQEIVAQSGDITALDWVGRPSEFNSCLPADITPYKALPCISPSLSEDEMQMSVSSSQNAGFGESASALYSMLDNLTAPRFANRRLHLPCLAFTITEVAQGHSQDLDMCSAYEIKADGLKDLRITTEDRLVQFSPARPSRRTFLLVRPWNRDDLGLPDFADDTESLEDGSLLGFPAGDSLGESPGEIGPVDSDPYSRALRLIIRLGQPFGALLLAQQRGGEYKRIASDRNIIAQVKDIAALRDMTDVRTVEIL